MGEVAAAAATVAVVSAIYASPQAWILKRRPMSGTCLPKRTLELSREPGQALWTCMMCAWCVSPRRTAGGSSRSGGRGCSTALCMPPSGQRSRRAAPALAALTSLRVRSSNALRLQSSEMARPATGVHDTLCIRVFGVTSTECSKTKLT